MFYNVGEAHPLTPGENDEMMKLEQILRGSPYGLTRFAAPLVERLEKSIRDERGRMTAPCLVRKRNIRMTPEEVVRQLLLTTLAEVYGYPLNLLAVEYPVHFGREVKRADLVVIDRQQPSVPYIVAEVKKPRARDGREQLRSYCNATGAMMALWTNGGSVTYFHRRQPNHFQEIRDIPRAGQSLADILQMKWTLEDLVKGDKLAREGRSLRDVIEGLEDEVLSGAGVAVFEEVFKLVYAKLYDEWVSGHDEESRQARNLEFHDSGHNGAGLKEKIQALFDRAREQWPGVFPGNSRIELEPSHLALCVSSLEGVKLLNSNLDVVDDAFEYLVSKESKGEKGQYFTPRHVIDMCVKMLDPAEDETLIDTAAGSAGFPIHAVFHVWRKILARMGRRQCHLLSSARKPRECEDYVRRRVFAADFDEKTTRVARALNVIAGDGASNVLRLNTLDYKKWDETLRDENWRDVNQAGFSGLRKLRADEKSFRDFRFDIVMANPPFAGNVKGEVVRLYELGRKPSGREGAERGWREQAPRHVLFIERNLQFLKPGGRMAIVLPQSVFNNVTDSHIRRFIAEQARVLAVVGLHENTFKPHTGTKTSVLLVQKWNDDAKAGPLCPRGGNHPVFFAVSRRPGKKNSGDKIYVRRPGEAEGGGKGGRVLDAHGHLIVDHDLFNLRAHHFPEDGGDPEAKALDRPGIAEAFMEFAKREGLSFAKKN